MTDPDGRGQGFSASKLPLVQSYQPATPQLNYDEDDIAPAIPAFGTTPDVSKKRKHTEVVTGPSDDFDEESYDLSDTEVEGDPSAVLTGSEMYPAKRSRTTKHGGAAEASYFTRRAKTDEIWMTDRLTSFPGRFSDLMTEEFAEILRRNVVFIHTNLGAVIKGLAVHLNPAFHDRVFMMFSKSAVSIPRAPQMPLEHRAKVGMVFRERTVGFSHNEGAPLGNDAAGTALGKVSTKRRFHIVRAIVGDDEFLTTCVETHGERGLRAPSISPDTYWQWLRVADARDRNPTNHGPHGVLKVDTSQATKPVRISDMSYVLAGASSRCTLTKDWDFAGYLDEASVSLLETIGKRVTTSQQNDKLNHGLYESINWDAIDDGRNAMGLAAYPRPDRRPPPRQTETPQHHPDNDESDKDRRRSDHRRRSDRRGRNHRDSSRQDRGYSNTASYEKDRPQRPRGSNTRSSQPRPTQGKRAVQYDDVDRSKADAPRGDHTAEVDQSWNNAVEGISAGSVYISPNYHGRESTGRTDRVDQSWNNAVNGITAGSVYISPNYYCREARGRTDRKNGDEGPSGSRGLGGYYDRS
ncbi:hypothetical protein J4E83_009746 [Alternaria metachromatica]|uniref:uncharacterized protein n=1 Tax=Alternaria metachromatica TaxID=283354 RepID=UPI0020C3754A|nr:uncharacterized protein J4E83_009746 [Alternaria metachromatica]KAI4606991.1 hypothetical protein J4E83_009746 [Alternaria metachromatica]